jgi:GTP:adenosylcobinamide-phosphate guanylyltransferase
MNADSRLTALVLAGSRKEGDPLAAAAGVSHKALIPVGGQPMLERVVSALAAVRVKVSAVKAAEGPSASTAAVLAAEGTPLLVTTADHALLRPEWVEEFLDADDGGADALMGLARSESVMAAAPGTLRTWLRFSDGDYSGCNLFLLRTPAAAGIVTLWRQLEADRKRPLALLSRLGFTYVLRYRFGWLTLKSALARLGRLCGARLNPVVLSDGEAAIDVDKPADLTLVRELVSKRDADRRG